MYTGLSVSVYSSQIQESMYGGLQYQTCFKHLHPKQLNKVSIYIVLCCLIINKRCVEVYRRFAQVIHKSCVDLYKRMKHSPKLISGRNSFPMDIKRATVLKFQPLWQSSSASCKNVSIPSIMYLWVQIIKPSKSK